MSTIGSKIGPTLVKIEENVADMTDNYAHPIGLNNAQFIALSRLFISALYDKMWELQNLEEMPVEVRQDMYTKVNEEVCRMMVVYADIDAERLMSRVDKGVKQQ